MQLNRKTGYLVFSNTIHWYLAMGFNKGLKLHFPAEAKHALIDAITTTRETIADSDKVQGRLTRDDKVTKILRMNLKINAFNDREVICNICFYVHWVLLIPCSFLCIFFSLIVSSNQ